MEECKRCGGRGLIQIREHVVDDCPNCNPSYRNMSLRDYFAGQVCGDLIARNRDRKLVYSPEEMAETAYTIADAMLKQRLKEDK